MARGPVALAPLLALVAAVAAVALAVPAAGARGANPAGGSPSPARWPWPPGSRPTCAATPGASCAASA